MKTDLFQSCGHCWVFQLCWHIECSTFTAASFRIWNSSTGIPSTPLVLFNYIEKNWFNVCPSRTLNLFYVSYYSNLYQYIIVYYDVEYAWLWEYSYTEFNGDWGIYMDWGNRKCHSEVTFSLKEIWIGAYLINILQLFTFEAEKNTVTKGKKKI